LRARKTIVEELQRWKEGKGSTSGRGNWRGGRMRRCLVKVHQNFRFDCSIIELNKPRAGGPALLRASLAAATLGRDEYFGEGESLRVEQAAVRWK